MESPNNKSSESYSKDPHELAKILTNIIDQKDDEIKKLRKTCSHSASINTNSPNNLNDSFEHKFIYQLLSRILILCIIFCIIKIFTSISFASIGSYIDSIKFDLKSHPRI